MTENKRDYVGSAKRRLAHHAVVITSEKYARSEWGDCIKWCDECNGWVSR